MVKQGRLSKCSNILGFIYFLFNFVLFTVILILAIFTTGKYLQFSPGWIFLTFPAIGMLSGYWIRTGKYGWWRSLIVAFSCLCSAVFLFIAFVGGPQMEKVKEEKFAKWQEVELAKNTKQMFDGVYSEDINMLKEQLEKGVDVNAVNETQSTALHITKDTDIARMLLERDANIHARDDAGMTPIFNKEVEIAGMLLDAGADINAKSTKGNTPFIWYTYSGYLEGIQFLVSRGAKINMCNSDNHNAVDIAKHFHPQTDILQYLMTLEITPCK